MFAGLSRSGREEEIEAKNTVLYPVFMNLEGRRCVMIGGGGVASRKARRLLQARAEVVVISPEIQPELASVATEVHERPYEYGDLDGAHLAFVATDSRETNARATSEANERGVPVNVADDADGGDFALPSALRRGRLQVAVSTGGASPTLARDIRLRLEDRFGPEWAGLVEEVGAAREAGLRGERRTDERLESEVSRCLSRL